MKNGFKIYIKVFPLKKYGKFCFLFNYTTICFFSTAVARPKHADSLHLLIQHTGNLRKGVLNLELANHFLLKDPDSSIVSGNGISGTWSPAINNTATTTYTFTPAFGQCAPTALMTVAVNSVDTGITAQQNTITAAANGATFQWVNCLDNQPINGATTNSFTPVENGSYAVIVTQNGCSQMSDCIAITIFGAGT